MAEIKTKTVVTSTIVISMTEAEARALDAITCYGADKFIAVFYEHMGTSYLGPWENGIKSLFASIQNVLPAQLNNIDKVRKTFAECTKL